MQGTAVFGELLPADVAEALRTLPPSRDEVDIALTSFGASALVSDRLPDVGTSGDLDDLPSFDADVGGTSFDGPGLRLCDSLVRRPEKLIFSTPVDCAVGHRLSNRKVFSLPVDSATGHRQSECDDRTCQLSPTVDALATRVYQYRYRS